MFFEDRDKFLNLLNSDIYIFVHLCREYGLQPALRLNITSDIRWERYGIPQRWSDVKFYDYTRLPNRKGIPINYHLTFSFDSNKIQHCRAALSNGISVAVPFKVAPKMFLGHQVIDGDEHDMRWLDPSPCVIGLRPKGRLRSQPDSLFLGDNHPALCA